MEIVRLSSKDIKQLRKYILDPDIENTESKLYLYKHKQLLKLFTSSDPNYIESKLFVLNKLFYVKDSVNFEEVVWPNSLVKVRSLSTGFLMDFIDNNTNIAKIFNAADVTMEDKIYFLYKIGKILEKIECDENLKEIGFHLGDIHEGNFIYDNKNNILKVVDIDSSMIDGANAPTSKFLTFNDKLWDFNHKYPLDENDRHISNYNTTIISYIYMLLNLITGKYSPDLSIKQFCEVLNKLSSLRVSKELLDSIYNIYTPKDNYFDFEQVKSIDSKLILKYRELSNTKK